ncbi:CD1375 family protein [Tissierella carlieri]|uniref:CD1375 family protein n=1 Tax=Tissierella carlieri TaxID=689904 RepID=A0ABT1SC60_9FIRM|nr:CD1375 family protein [Tissierella carlieri]MCQ4924068.1 CD1375 family protein [Tissierella carlieri]
MVKAYMIKVYAVLIKNEKREIETLPEEYIVPVAEFIASQEESKN